MDSAEHVVYQNEVMQKTTQEQPRKKTHAKTHATHTKPTQPTQKSPHKNLAEFLYRISEKLNQTNESPRDPHKTHATHAKPTRLTQPT